VYFVGLSAGLLYRISPNLPNDSNPANWFNSVTVVQAPNGIQGPTNPNNIIPMTMPGWLTDVSVTLYFTRDGGTSIWRWDATNNNVFRVSIVFSQAPAPANLTALGSRLFFTANGPIPSRTGGYYGTELWTTDGTVDGTQIVRDINPLSAGSNPSYLTAVNSTWLYFNATDANGDSELWRTDAAGTLANTTRVAQINPSGANPTNLVAAGSGLYFLAN